LPVPSVPPPSVDFGRAAGDYAAHRQGFPASLFDRLERLGVVFQGSNALDVGTGTGLFARDMALRGATVTGIDPSQELLAEAEKANASAASPIRYIQGVAEDTGLPSSHFDIVSAATCWHWFDRARAAREAARLTGPAGFLLICHLDWWRGTSGIVDMTADVTRRFNPDAARAGAANTFQHPSWLADLRSAGFSTIDVLGYTTALRYSIEGWVGRVKASASVGPVLGAKDLRSFELALSERLRSHFPTGQLDVEHIVFAVVGRKA
jgi:SAM-dependent methyltransferase